jgi:4-hydroxyphenylpyruvate dioxygenase
MAVETTQHRHSAAELDLGRAHINPLGIRGIDHIHFIVDDAEKWARWYEECFGMYRRAVGDASTGLDGRRGVVVGQARVNFVFTEPAADSDSPIARMHREHLEKHGGGVKDVAFRVLDARVAIDAARRAGAKVIREAQEECDGQFVAGAIAAYGDTVHTFMERRQHRIFAPGYVNVPGGIEDRDIQFMMIDHVVANVEHMDEWVDFYHRVFGFDQTAHFDINTGRSALMSKVVGDDGGYIKLPINEPSSANSQIQVFLDDYRGPGVQHIALLTPNIIATVAEMRRAGVRFLDVPDSYYEMLPARVGEIREDMQTLRDLRILVDRDRPDGYLLQLFTEPVFDRPTLFHEVIQRHGNSDGFGEGNFRALFEAIEREQARRGLL